MRGIDHWHRLPQETVETLSLERFKSCLDTILVKWPHMTMEVGRGDLRGACQHPPLHDANAEGLITSAHCRGTQLSMQVAATPVRETDKCHHHHYIFT